MTVVLCWDIDGTLLTTGGAAIRSWEEAAAEVLGEAVDLGSAEIAGLTDPLICRRIIRAAGREPAPDLMRGVIARYERLLPDKLRSGGGEVLPNVSPVLDALRARGDVLSLLLTGNTEAAAAAKLRHFGLARYFRDGAFSDRHWQRPAIARNAARIARRHLGEVPGESIYVIGDTPHDIACARAIGARSVAVASGPHGLHELRRHDPWWLLPRLPGADAFVAGLGLPPTPGP